MSYKINIRPHITILSVLRFLNYKPWYAIAEYVDNAIGSYHKERKILEKFCNQNHVRIDIDLDPTVQRIIIKDNAGGIHKNEFDRAFRAADIPPDTSDLCEFGMGMKSASCWFANNWSVRTKSLEDENEYEIKFNISEITQKQKENIEITSKKVKKTSHYTIIELKNIHSFPVKKSLGKIKKHLTSMYRQFIREGEVKIFFNGEELIYEEPKILFAPHYKDPKGNPINWVKNIDINIDSTHKAKGFVAIRETASTSDAGFAIFRKNRVIQDSGDEGYRPETILGSSNSFIFQRVFGEIFLDGFGVSHTKDGIQWEGLEEVFLEKLKKELKKDPDILSMAHNYRKNPKPQEMIKNVENTLEKVSLVIEREIPAVIQELMKQPIDQTMIQEELPPVKDKIHRVIPITLDGDKWEVHLEFSAEENYCDWIDVGERYIKEENRDKQVKKVGIRVSLQHPFMIQFGTNENFEPIVRIAAAIGIAEVLARDSGVKSAGTIRKNINELMEPLSKPE